MDEGDAPIVCNYDIKKLNDVIKLNEIELNALVKNGYSIKKIDEWVPKYQQIPSQDLHHIV